MKLLITQYQAHHMWLWCASSFSLAEGCSLVPFPLSDSDAQWEIRFISWLKIERVTCRYACNTPLNWSHNPLTDGDPHWGNTALRGFQSAAWCWKVSGKISPIITEHMPCFSTTPLSRSLTSIISLNTPKAPQGGVMLFTLQKRRHWKQSLRDTLKVTQLLNDIYPFWLSLSGSRMLFLILISLHS